MKKVSNFKKKISITLLEVSSFAGSRDEEKKLRKNFNPLFPNRQFAIFLLLLLSFSQFVVGEGCTCISFNSAERWEGNLSSFSTCCELFVVECYKVLGAV
jgi:hypothetical protein